MGVFLYILITIIFNSFITRMLKSKKSNKMLYPIILFVSVETALPHIFIKTNYIVEDNLNTVLAALVILIYPFYYGARWSRLLK